MATDLTGRRLGEFEVVCELGRGGMGVVYEAVQTSLNRRVALKVLGPGLGLTPRAVDRFNREAAAAAKLHHTNIVPVYATGEDGGVHFYAMELIVGPSLDAVIRQMRTPAAAPELPADLLATGPYRPTEPTPPPPSGGSGPSAERFDRAAALIADVADALHHAHQNGVTHRDIKPSNLLLSADGRLSVTDFGLARVLEQPGMTVTGEFVGTPAYMSPEQITAGRIPVDHRTDIYSLGATLYELLTLRPPFVADGRDKLLALVVQKEPAAPRSVEPKVPRDLETICLKCLEKDPDRRYQSGAELADDLRRYVRRFAIRARPTGPLGRAKKWVKRNPWVAGLAAAVLVAVGAAGYFAHQSSRRQAEQTAAREALRDEMMRQAGQRALQGDFVRAEQAVRDALALGAPAGWADWRRGQVVYHRGETGKAIEWLDRAVSEPTAPPAARSLLAAAHMWAGNGDEYERYRDRPTAAPATAEDTLYLGLATSFDDPAEGLRLLDRAVADEPSLIAHVIRAQVRADQAMHTSDPALADEAIADATAAKVILRDNPAALCVSSWVHQIAAALYPPAAAADRARAAAAAGRDADALAAYPDLPMAVLVRGWYLDATGREAEAGRVWEAGLDQPGTAGLCAHALLRRGDLAGVRRVADARLTGTPGDRVYRSWLLADDPATHPAAVAELRAYAAGLSVWRRPAEYRLLLLLGRKAEAVAVTRADLAGNPAPPPGPSWPADLARFLADPSRPAEDELVRRAGRSRRVQTSTHFTIGLSRLADGDRTGARGRFEAAVAAGCFYSDSHTWSKTFLARLAADPAWPGWIPAGR